MKSIAIGSANDAAVVFAEALGRKRRQFRENDEQEGRTNRVQEHLLQQKKKIRTGLPAEGHYTTARDVALMDFLCEQIPRCFELYESVRGLCPGKHGKALLAREHEQTEVKLWKGWTA